MARLHGFPAQEGEAMINRRYYTVLLDDGTRLQRKDAIAKLSEDGGYVPCSRYGRNSEDCAWYAWEAFKVFARENGDDSWETLDHMMSLAVNDSDEIAYLINRYNH